MAFGFSYSHKTKDINNAWKDLGKTSTGIFNSGNVTATEGIGDLNSLGAQYQDALKNPLGTGPNSASGIFARARGGVADAATRTTSAFGARLSQQARQNGGNLSPEAQAELSAQNSRDVAQGVFTANNAISDSEASATLTETSKLFDRLTDISKTILGAGERQSAQGLNALIQSILGRQNLAFGRAAAATAAVGTAISAGSVGVSGQKGSSTSGGP